jgi:CBS domain containing-hemolysin-like protein
MSLSAVPQIEPVQVETLPSNESNLTKKQKIVDLIICICLVLFGGLMSGLTIGLASIDRLSLEVDSIGNPKVTLMCKRIFPVIDKHHWMLVTLLLCNAGAMEALPIFLDKLVSPVEAVVFSVTLVLIFGEIIPQALCTGPR